MENKKLTFAFMDPPFENERTITFFRIVDAALDGGADVQVFAYEGAAALAFALQKAHGNSVHHRDAEEEAHPLTKDWIAALQKKAERLGRQLDWVNCGLCVDERGVNESIPGCKRGSPADLWRYASSSFNTLVIGTR
ncbi:tRNA 2-thiouridine synthesizing protein D [Methylobacillus rhizosphaerae]|uniref:tRNA 2-thiouridine synthesizing protein D n=1 Tax=Methylobacillus rhizosphaerae TaxID=551994 RepID=A0A238ZS79_9PROT|nr:DsrE family protein [Methylobacillus rhizosphaerae]SNR86200.1 tRNA 2-thiouridine synthesizing protein D [Methylobacillus rhizosphaerae]